MTSAGIARMNLAGFPVGIYRLPVAPFPHRFIPQNGFRRRLRGHPFK